MRWFIRALLDAEDAWDDATSALRARAEERPLIALLMAVAAVNVAIGGIDLLCTLVGGLRAGMRRAARLQRAALAYCIRPAIVAVIAVAIDPYAEPLIARARRLVV